MFLMRKYLLVGVVVVSVTVVLFFITQKNETDYQAKQTNPYVEKFEREGKTTSNDVISLAWNQCGGQLWTVKKSITPIDSYTVIITKYACTKGGEYINGQFYEDGKPVTPLKGTEGYSYSGQNH